MSKITIITGKQGSGKTTKALEIAANYEKNEVAFFNLYPNYRQNAFCFSHCTENTKLIIADGFSSIEQAIKFAENIQDWICVNKKFQDPYIIRPDFILEVSSNYEFITCKKQII